VRLWTHEVLRVFYDRLVDDGDRLWIGGQLGELAEKHFKEKVGEGGGVARMVEWGASCTGYESATVTHCIDQVHNSWCLEEPLMADHRPHLTPIFDPVNQHIAQVFVRGPPAMLPYAWMPGPDPTQITRVLGVDRVDDTALLTSLRSLMFGDFMVPGADPKVYTEIKDQVREGGV
jgi:hypothetical protein